MFTVPLSDQTCKETQDAIFECEVSKPNKPVTWYCYGKKIKPSDKYEIVVDGTVHRLIVHDAELTDKAKFSAKVEKDETSATLTVDGGWRHMTPCPLWNFSLQQGSHAPWNPGKILEFHFEGSRSGNILEFCEKNLKYLAKPLKKVLSVENGIILKEFCIQIA